MRAVLLSAMGEPLTADEHEHFRELTQRDEPPTSRAKQAFIIAGRRAGKSSGCAALATYLSCLCDFSDSLMAGERGVCLIVAETQQQATVLFGYIEGVLESSPALKKMIVKRTQTTIRTQQRHRHSGSKRRLPRVTRSNLYRRSLRRDLLLAK